MKRREFSHQLAAGGLLLAAGGLARAQGGPVEGTHYVKLSQPAPVATAAGKKVEVLEFFSYACPHCNSFEPALEAWLGRLPADVDFKRVPVGFNPMFQMAQRAFFALEESGQLAALHKRVFAAIHVQGQRLVSEKAYTDFVAAEGGDAAKFSAAWRGFSVNTKLNRARLLSDAYKIDGVPAMGVQGRFYTSGSLAGGNERMLAVVDFLAERVRKGG